MVKIDCGDKRAYGRAENVAAGMCKSILNSADGE
jgi:hypothetical protein